MRLLFFVLLELVVFISHINVFRISHAALPGIKEHLSQVYKRLTNQSLRLCRG